MAQYPFISKTLRDIDKPKEERKHCCGMTIQNEGIGYKDLDDLFAKPCDLEFILGKNVVTEVTFAYLHVWSHLMVV